VLSSFGVPVAAVAGLLTVAIADPPEIGLGVGIAVLIIGMVLAGTAVHEIRRNPARWRGLRLAKASFALPVLLAALFGVVAGVKYFDQRAEIEASRRETRQRMAKEKVRVFVRRTFDDLTRLGPAATFDDLLLLVPPSDRERLLSLSPEERRRNVEAREIDLARLLPSRVSHPLRAFEVDSIEFLDEALERASVTMRCDAERLVFRVIRREGNVYLDVGPVEHAGGAGVPARADPADHFSEAAVRRQVKEYLAMLVSLDNRQGGEEVHRFVDPELSEQLSGQSREELGPSWFEGRKGLAMFDHSVLGRPLSEFEISRVDFDEDNREWVSVALECGDESLRFQLVSREDIWGEGERFVWYLALTPIEHLGPKGKIYSASERLAIRNRIEDLMQELPKYPDLSDLEPVLPAVDPRERGRLRALSEKELEKLRSEDLLGMAFFPSDALPAVAPSSGADDVRVEGDEGTHTWHLGDDRVTFPIVRVDGLWYLGVGRVRLYESR
jgi:hypothetical protein